MTDIVIFSIQVTETQRSREYWANRPGLSNDVISRIRDADIIFVPWEKFRDDYDTLFPQGTGKLYNYLKHELKNYKIEIAEDVSAYKEIALHSNEFRSSTLFVSLILLPALVNLATSQIEKWLYPNSSSDIMELEVIVEGDMGKCISIKYRGPAKEFPGYVLKHAQDCFQKINAPTAQPAPSVKDAS